MRTKLYFVAAMAAVGLISCADDAFIAEAPPVNNVDEGMAPIMFSSSQSAFTRADFVGAEAAAKLGNKFVVTGFKGTATASPGSVVFDNYLVKYVENTANTTESNSNNWEYVLPNVSTGATYEYVPITHARDNGIVSQTIKYWDYSVAQYDFFAWSAGKNTAIFTGAIGDLSDGQVLVSKMQPNSKAGTTGWATGDAPTRPAYSFKGSAKNLSECFISDLVTVNKTGTAAGTYGEVSGYNQPVTLKFRQLGTKVRIAIYETVPGYSVKDVKFYTAAAVNLADETTGTDEQKAAAVLQNETATLFTTTTGTIHTEGEAIVYFPTVDLPNNADNNQAHIKFVASGTSKANVDGGTLNYTVREEAESSTDNVYLGRTSNTATFAGTASDNYYVYYIPNENGVNLNLRVNYTLESIDGSGEEITVKGATAQVPLIYTQWKPGYAYTYIFKISDKTNGYTGIYDPTNPNGATTESSPEGLYPITFDAMVVNAEEGNTTQETITTVSAPSITTYQNGSNVVNKNEYTVLTSTDPLITGEIFVTVNDTENDVTPDLANGNLVTLAGIGVTAAKNVQLYIVASGTTEAEVVDALQYQEVTPTSGSAITGRNKLELIAPATPNALSLSSSVTYGVDGNTITLTGNQAAKFVPAANTTYAFVYTKKAATATTEKFQPVTKTVDDPSTAGTNEAESVEGLYRYTLVAASTSAEDVREGVKYFANDDGSTGMITAFLGQTVNNLYTRTGAGTNESPYVYTPASGYAVTGTTYYYTINGGKDYEAATEVAYADFGSTNLWKNSSKTDGSAKSEATPVNGQAYYDTYGKYCVIYPQQTTGLYVFKGKEYETANMTACTSSEKAVYGMVYFYKYNYNDAVRYAKIIKVQ